MNNTKVLIRSNRVKKKINGTAVLIYYHHQDTVYFNTGVFVHPSQFNKKLWIRETTDGHETLRKKIKKKRDHIENLIEEFKLKNFRLPTGSELKRFAIRVKVGFPLTENDGKYSLLADFSDWIKSRHDISEGTKKIYLQTKRYLALFLNDKSSDPSFKILSLYNVDLKFLEEFANFLSGLDSIRTKQSLSNSTINKQIRGLQNFLRRRRKKDKVKISDEISDYEFSTSFTPREQLNQTEIQRILSVASKLDNYVDAGKITKRRKVTLTTVLDMITLNIEVGLRVRDLLNLESNDIYLLEEMNDYYIEIPAIEKTEQSYKIPIVDDHIIMLLRKYWKENEKIFPHMSIVTFNKSLRKLAELAGLTSLKDYHYYSLGKKKSIKRRKCDLLSSHSLRKTSINRNILTYGRDIAKVISQHRSESGFKPYEDYNHYETIREQMMIKKRPAP